MAETRKAHDRRLREDWYRRFVRTPLLDVGSGVDPIPVKGATHWDYQWTYTETEDSLSWQNDPGDRDAQTLKGLADESFMCVYASHILEHLEDPVAAIKNWWRVLKPGGYLIMAVPHRDLYEKKKEHPSRWNPRDREGGGGHLTFWLPDKAEDPDTLSLIDAVRQAVPPDAEIHDFRVIDEGYDYNLPPDIHPIGEYAIEMVLRKPLGDLDWPDRGPLPG